MCGVYLLLCIGENQHKKKGVGTFTSLFIIGPNKFVCNCTKGQRRSWLEKYLSNFLDMRRAEMPYWKEGLEQQQQQQQQLKTSLARFQRTKGKGLEDLDARKNFIEVRQVTASGFLCVFEVDFDCGHAFPERNGHRESFFSAWQKKKASSAPRRFV